MILKTASLMPEVIAIIKHAHTEAPYSGEYDQQSLPGTYLCRQCGLALFRSKHKFHSGCGWPSFDNPIDNAIKERPDVDGKRIEILCQRCEGHLGHVFTGEGFTPLNTRHCVNSLSLDYVSDLDVCDTEELIIAAGCFWGVEYYFNKLPGILKTEVGYTGGNLDNPTYEAVCSGTTGHYEAMRVIYDPEKLSSEAVIKYFFEIHDFTQTNGQGPDIGTQYLSAIFYYDETQKNTIKSVMIKLELLGYSVATHILPVQTFWPAELYHQDYYDKTGKAPYCHRYQKLF